MAITFGSILHLGNSGSEATLDANNLRGTTLLIDELNSASLATIGFGETTAPGKRRLGTIVSTTGSATTSPKYYVYKGTDNGDSNISGSDWTTLSNWSQLTTQDSLSSYSTIVQLNNSSSALQTNINLKAPIANPSFTGNITASGNISASGEGYFNTVGIGIDSPSHTLEVRGPESTLARFYDSSNGSIGQIEIGTMDIRVDSDTMQFRDSSNNSLVTINTGGHLTASGNISASGDIFSNNLTVSNSLTIGGVVLENIISTEITSTTTKFSGSIIIGSGSTADSVPSISNQHQITGSITITGSGMFPDPAGAIDLGDLNRKFNNIFAVNTFFGGVHEINLETEGLDQMQEGTILTLKNGVLHPCEKEADPLVMGIVSKGENFPIVLGAEPVLITGKIKEGDYIITSNIKGHGIGIDPKYIYSKQLFGKIIAQAIESGSGKSYTIKAMIRKM